MKNLEKYWLELSDDPLFIAESISFDIVENISELMFQKNIDRKTLAEKLGTSKAYVTKLLNGNPNLTLLSLAKIAVALGAEIRAPRLFDESYETYKPNLSITTILKDLGNEHKLSDAA